jgi:hypothetical protein
MNTTQCTVPYTVIMLPSTFIVRLCGLERRFTAKNTHSIAFLQHKRRTNERQRPGRGGGGGLGGSNLPNPQKNSEVLTNSRIPSSVENTAVTT